MERQPASLLFFPIDVLTALLLFDMGAWIGGLIMLGFATWVVLERLAPTLVQRRGDHSRAVGVVVGVSVLVAVADFVLAV